MTHETAILFFWLGILTRRRYDLLMPHFGSLDAVREGLSPELLTSIGIKGKRLEECWNRYTSFNIERYAKEMDRLGIKLMTIEDDIYPQALKHIADPPLFLSYKGSVECMYNTLVGVVGTRRMSHYGKRSVELFVPPLVRAGITTVSGLALGVDAAVARETCAAGGTSIAVLGHGLSHVFPRTNAPLAEEILQQGGLLLSEYPLEMHPETYTFPARNRIIAGLSKATLVCEAPEESGAIITAELAFEYGREVFAVPHSIFDTNSLGCNNLIARGQARLAQTPEDILRDLGMVSTTHTEMHAPPLETDDEKSVFACLSALPQSVDELAERAALDTSRIGVALTFMELSGAAKNIGEGRWVRV